VDIILFRQVISINKCSLSQNVTQLLFRQSISLSAYRILSSLHWSLEIL